MKRILFITNVFLLFLSFSTFAQSNSQNTVPSSYPDGFHIGFHTEGFLMQKKHCHLVQQFSGIFRQTHHRRSHKHRFLLPFLSLFWSIHWRIPMDPLQNSETISTFPSPIQLWTMITSPTHTTYLLLITVLVFKDFRFQSMWSSIHPIGCSNWFYYTNAGINIINAFEVADHAVRGRNHYDQLCGQDHTEIIINETNELVDIFEEEYYAQDLKNGKSSVDLQLKAGLYYKLPYSDLIRFEIISNISFTDRLQGKYSYLLVNVSRTKSYRHNYLGIEFGYIHCFSTKNDNSADRHAT